MPDEEIGWKWWIRYVVVPLIGGGGIIAIIVALLAGPTEPTYEPRGVDVEEPQPSPLHTVFFVHSYSPRDHDPRRSEPRGTHLWANGTTIRIAFLDGELGIQQKIVQIAREWTKHANLTFEFGPVEGSDVRITLDPDKEGYGVAGLPGTAALQRSDTGATMTMSLLRPDLSNAEFRRPVLYGFGHIIGLMAEWNNPNSDIPWNKEVASRSFNSPWPSSLFGIDKPFDKRSIMLPHISNELTQGDYENRQPTELSEGDKEFVVALYPTQVLDGAVPLAPPQEQN